MIRIRNIRLPAGSGREEIIEEIAKILCLRKIYPGNSYPDFSYRILRRSIDARRKPEIFFVYTVELLAEDETERRILKYLHDNRTNPRVSRKLDKILTEPVTEYVIPECGTKKLSSRPVVVGAGPSGLFCALLLARRGFAPLLIERGEPADKRSRRVSDFWAGGAVDPDSNVAFGEGGAGTFSDGKLTTLTKDVSGRNTYVIKTFYEHGAPENITYDAKPHIGTDILTSVVMNIRKEIISLGGEVLFNTRLSDIGVSDDALSYITVVDVCTGHSRKIKTDICILCIGHSARDTFEMLYGRNVSMRQKNFAAGFRVIHPQSMVNMWQYGRADNESAGLPAADYKVTNETGSGRRVYSFCMCPGGYVVNASSEVGGICVNGMSENKRDAKYANSAIIAAVTPEDFVQDEVAADHPLAGMYYQRNIEHMAYLRGKGRVPIQCFGDFEQDTIQSPPGDLSPTDAVKGEAVTANLRGIFSEAIDSAVIESMHKFGYTMKGFDECAVMAGVEARTSSPVRIERDDHFVSNIKGIYPCGEGAGYAGGIVSAAADGIKCAEEIIKSYTPETENG